MSTVYAGNRLKEWRVGEIVYDFVKEICVMNF